MCPLLVLAVCTVAAGGAARALTVRPNVVDGGCSDFLPPGTVVGMASLPDGHGYWIVNRNGEVAACGDAPNLGSLGFTPAEPVVGMAATPDGGGYWLVASDGGVFSFGDASFYGSTGGTHLNKPMVGMAVTPSGRGYWLVAADGGIFAYGDAAFHGSTGSITLNQPVVGMSSDAATGGYWLVAADGGVFAFDAPFLGSMGGTHLNQPVVGMSSTIDNGGYWLVAADGGIFAFNAPFEGSTGAIQLNEPVVGMAPGGASGGYWLVASDGGVFAFDVPFVGSAVAPPSQPLPAAPACSVSLANPTPPQDSNETVDITSNIPSGSAGVTVGAGPASRFFAVGTDAGGNTSVTFGVGGAAPGDPIAVQVSLDAGAAACSGSYTPGVPVPAASVTPDGTGYVYSLPRAGTVLVTAPATSGGNEREFFWGGDSPDEADSTVCATFSTGQGLDQQGIVLRLNDANGIITGVTVTRNVIYYDYQDFNFHVWNTSDAKQPFTQFGQTVLPFLPTFPPVYPLSMCARTVTATNQVQFVVWTAGQSQPAWGDPSQGGEASLPADAPSSGQGGFFAGHLVPGTDMTYTDLTIDGDAL